MSDHVVDEINGRAMRARELVHHYGQTSEVTQPERAILERVRSRVAGERILDLGVGGGRTVPALHELSAHYVGIDYSEEMIETCRRRYPNVQFEHGDVRALTAHGAESFAFALFSCNGLGMIGHADRLRSLREIYRVVRSGGYFAFSAHNQRSPDHDAGLQLPPFERTNNPLKLGVRIARLVKHHAIGAYNHYRHREHEVRTPTYSIINDRCHNYATMLYYISMVEQRRQLEEAGFRDVVAFDLAGRVVGDEDTRDSSIYYLAAK
jgi:ubiquinone/menaquinone biosynthesis C-methylase UbiE